MDIALSSDALDVALHPTSSKNLLATGLISGKVQLIDFSQGAAEAGSSSNGSKRAQTTAANYDAGDGDDDGDEVQATASTKSSAYAKRWTVRPSNKSCRGVAFGADGEALYTLAKDGSVFGLSTETGAVVTHWSKAHDAAPSRLCMIEPNLLATGDDDGVVSLWDPRRPAKADAAVHSFTHHFDWITSMLWCTHLAPRKQPKPTKAEEEKKRMRDEKKRKRMGKRKGKTGLDAEPDDEDNAERRAVGNTPGRERLVVTSGDGTLSVIDVRAGKAGVEVSEDQEDELLSIASVKRQSKLIVGTQLGMLSLWAPSKGLLDHVDRIPGHPASVDALCTLDDDTILTGSSDGLVRVVQILPHKLLGIVADHGGMPVERLTRRDNWLASIGHGPEIKLTDLAPLLEDDDEDDDDDEEAERRPLGITHLVQDVAGDASSSEGEEDDGEGAEETSLQSYSQDDDNEDGSEQYGKAAVKTSISASKKARLDNNPLKPPPQAQRDTTSADFFADL